MAASLKDKRTPITTPPYQVPSVDVTPDPPIFSLVTTFKYIENETFSENSQDEIIQIIKMESSQLQTNFILKSHK
jgi:hypothetical protein